MRKEDIIRDHFLAIHQDFAGTAAGDGQWLKGLRAASLDRFASLGIPNRRWEDWRFTPLRSLVDRELQWLPQRGEVKAVDPSWCENELVFCDGVYAPELSRVAADAPISVLSLRAALDDAQDGAIWRERMEQVHAAFPDKPFMELHQSFAGEGVAIHVRGERDGKRQSIAIRHISSGDGIGRAKFPTVLVRVEKTCSLTLVEQFEANRSNSGFHGDVCRLDVGAGAHVRYYRLLAEPCQDVQVSHVSVAAERDSHCEVLTLQAHRLLCRQDLSVTLAEEGANVVVDGLYCLGDKDLVDNHTIIQHKASHTRSSQFYKGILAGEAQAIFAGRIDVDPSAQGTEAHQLNNNLMLSDDCHVHTQPQLWIGADDIRCSHGATIAQLDPTEMFYIRSRGIEHEEATQMLGQAFAGEVVERIQDEDVRKIVRAQVAAAFTELTKGGVR